MGGLLRPSQHANPAHFIVPNTLSRVRTARITCSVFDRRIPSSALVNVGDGVFVASPELCLLLEARTAAFASLVETGYELCGSYRLAASSDAGMMSDQLPLTSTSKLQSFLSRARNLNGVDTARKAVPHILPNSESPKESQLSILSSFPGRLGGYGFPQPTLNHPVRISEKARGRNVGGTCRCDLFWPDAVATSNTTVGFTMQARPSRRRTRPAEPRWRTRASSSSPFRAQRAAHEVGDGQGRPRDGETAGNEMPLAGARLGTQADQAAITAARHHATGNAGRKNGTHDNNRPPKAPPPFAFSGKGLATFRDEAEIAR